jgi:DNA modification methylase
MVTDNALGQPPRTLIGNQPPQPNKGDNLKPEIIQADSRFIPLAAESVQMVVTSPPYWGLRKYEGNQGVCYGLEQSLTEYVQHTIEILREIRRVLRQDGVVFWNIADSYAGGGNYRGLNSENTLTSKQRSNKGATGVHQELGSAGKDTGTAKPKDLCLIPFRVAIAAQEDGWWVRSAIIWNRPNPMPESVRDRPTDAYEFIFMLTKSSKYFWDKDAIAEPAVNAGKVVSLGTKSFSKGQANAAGVNPSGNGTKDFFNVGATRNMRNVWTFPTQPYRGSHVAAFPEELPRRCILAASRKGDIILDPFAGSGTTGRVALELGRRPILIDLAYQDQQKQRTQGVQQVLEGETIGSTTYCKQRPLGENEAYISA